MTVGEKYRKQADKVNAESANKVALRLFKYIKEDCNRISLIGKYKFKLNRLAKSESGNTQNGKYSELYNSSLSDSETDLIVDILTDMCNKEGLKLVRCQDNSYEDYYYTVEF